MRLLHLVLTTALGAGLLATTDISAQRAAPPARPVAPLTAADYIEIQQLLHKYAFAIDTCSNNGYDYADLYTPDGVFFWGIGGRTSVGREELAEAAGGGKNGCRKLKTTPDKPVQTHITVNEVIEPSPEGAIGKSYLVYPGVGPIRGDDAHGTRQRLPGRVLKTDKGWRFKKRIHVFPPDVPGSFVFPPDATAPAKK